MPRASAYPVGFVGKSTVTGTPPPPPPPPSNTYTLLGAATPATHDVSYAQPVEVGLKFTSDVPGSIVAIRFYKSAVNFGIHVGELWTVTGQHLASATFATETVSGWQQVNLPTPVPINAKTGYVVACHSQGPISYVDFSTSIDNAPLHAPASGILGGNGVFSMGPIGTFPALGGGQNYLVHVVFTTAISSATLTSIAVTPANSTLAAGASLQFHATATYSDGSTNDLTNQVGWSSDAPAVAVINSASGNALGVTAGTANISASLSGVSGMATLTVTGPPPPPPPPASSYTLLGSAIPDTRDSRYAQPVEMGLRFTSDLPGFIVAIRFYKSAANFGPHVGELWTVTGQRLASVTFTNETESGWQQVTLPAPVAIQANTAYLVSYHSPGPFSYIDFNSPIDNTPLHAPVSGTLGANGVFAIGPIGTFPGLGGGQNFLIDVVFTR